MTWALSTLSQPQAEPLGILGLADSRGRDRPAPGSEQWGGPEVGGRNRWGESEPRDARDPRAVNWLDRSGPAGVSSQSWRSFGGG